ncbi:MAG: hypothetical protein SOI44_09680 [Lactimicrobium sp.]|uniref:hypothetical protein n=1 Tax=Lactimicrobium sp. TaxID=2563780 RepID=UPI002F3576FE
MVFAGAYTCNAEVKMKIKPMTWIRRKDITGVPDRNKRGAAYWQRKKNAGGKGSSSSMVDTGGKHGND